MDARAQEEEQRLIKELSGGGEGDMNAMLGPAGSLRKEVRMQLVEVYDGTELVRGPTLEPADRPTTKLGRGLRLIGGSWPRRNKEGGAASGGEVDGKLYLFMDCLVVARTSTASAGFNVLVRSTPRRPLPPPPLWAQRRMPQKFG